MKLMKCNIFQSFESTLFGDNLVDCTAASRVCSYSIKRLDPGAGAKYYNEIRLMSEVKFELSFSLKGRELLLI